MNHQEYLNKSNDFFQYNQIATRMKINKLWHRQLTLYQYQVFIHKGPGGQRGAQYHVLSNTYYVNRLIPKTAAGRPVS